MQMRRFIAIAQSIDAVSGGGDTEQFTGIQFKEVACMYPGQALIIIAETWKWRICPDILTTMNYWKN
eukprot:scaffold33712_cov73-Skeletonema_marinoi.AAC.2